MSEGNRKYPSLYRVYDTIGPDGLTLLWQMYTVIGETPMCWYVITSDLAYLAQIPGHADTVKRRRKRVLKEQNGKRLCYTDKKRAMESYLQRKHWQLSHAAMSAARAKSGLSAARKLLDGSGEITLPATEESHHIQGLGWGDY